MILSCFLGIFFSDEGLYCIEKDRPKFQDSILFNVIEI